MRENQSEMSKNTTQHKLITIWAKNKLRELG